MKTFIAIILVLSLASMCSAEFGYVTERKTGRIVSYYDLKETPISKDYIYTPCEKGKKPEVYKDPLPVRYDPDELISWGLENLNMVILSPHIAVFLDTARANNPTAWGNFMIYAQAHGVADIANQIKTEAILLGATVE